MDHSEVQELVNHPAESLGVELKRWLDPTNEVDSALIARTLIASQDVCDLQRAVFGERPWPIFSMLTSSEF